jgi:hypothetical protein
MKYILVIEDDGRIQKELFDTLKSIDPLLQIRFFHDLSEFHEWLKKALADGPLSLAPGGRVFAGDATASTTPAADDQLSLVVAKNEFLGIQNMALIRRARDFFIRKNLCTTEEPTSCVLTAFDSPSFDILLAEERIINNVIFKPFDKLILKQHLEFAIGGRHPLDGNTISTIQINDKVEMLKRTHFNSISDLGFTTLNNHAIPVGAMTKYYSELFHTPSRRSLYAYCTKSEPRGPDQFHCEFVFYGAENEQLSKIRKYILQKPEHQEKEIPTAAPASKNILLLEEDAASGLSLAHTLQERFSQVGVFTYTSHGQLLSDLADKESAHRQTLPVRFDMIFANMSMLSDEKDKQWEHLWQAFTERAQRYSTTLENPPPIYLVSKRKVTPEAARKLYPWCREIFFFPLDRLYLAKKLQTLHPELLRQEVYNQVEVPDPSVVKIANMVDITQISEAGLVLKYYRPIALGSFREFILLRANEHECPEITGTCNFTDEIKGVTPPSFANHFVFFGMRDHFLKHIRLWLREAYIRQKSEE